MFSKEKIEIDGDRKLSKREQRVVNREKEKHHKDLVQAYKATMRDEKSAPENAYISLQHINKIYPNHIQAVYDFNLDIQKNEFIVFVGPSGCGKSTTIRMIAGLEEITYGDLFIDGIYSNELSPKDRQIGMVFQSYALYPHMTVYENIAFGLRVKHMSNKEVDERVHKAAKILQISEYLDRKPNALSGGQCQRVALGRAIVTDSKVFLMDEPLSNLDAKLRVAMRSEIVKLHRLLDATTIYVTHDQTEAMTMATRIVVMNKGYVQQIGTPSEIFDTPANLFVATFVGSPAMNLLEVKAVDNTLTFESGYQVKLEKEFESRVNKFYDQEINATQKKIDNWKQTFLSRLLTSAKYCKIFSNESINEKALSSFISSLRKDVLKSAGISESELMERVNAFTDKNLLSAYLNPLMEKYLFALNVIDNPDIRSLEETLTKLQSARHNKEKDLIFGIRPEHIRYEKEERSDTLALDVTVAELLGSEYHTHLTYGMGEIIVKLDSGLQIKSGNKINVLFDLSRIHIFDKITEKRI